MRTKLFNLTLGILATFTLSAPATTRYVDLSNPSPAPPFTSWATAATNIQDAIDVANASDEVIVTNGVYQTGGRAVADTALTNRVVVSKPLTVRSVNGPSHTTIQGYQVPTTTNGPSAVRGVYLSTGAVIAGFTIQGGATLDSGSSTQTYGGGVWCESRSALVTNCVIFNNAAVSRGGGAFSGTLSGCLILSNTIPQGGWWGTGGGVYDASLIRCQVRGNFAWYGAGAAYSSLTNCWLTGNWAWDVGGAADYCDLEHCALIGNLANGGGGAFSGTLNQCLIAGNSANWGGGTVSGTLTSCTITGNSAEEIGGAYCGTLNNCIINGNTAASDPNYLFDGEFFGLMNFCCTTPLPAEGSGNFTSPPVFVDAATGNYRLQTNSPCLNSGNNAYVANPADLDGRPRVVNDVVDIGAYEFQAAGLGEFTGWLEQAGLSTDGSADFSDADGDGANNWQEWRADTIPTNAASAFRLLSVREINFHGNRATEISWLTVPTRNYWIERTTNLITFETISTNLNGVDGPLTIVNASPLSGQHYFYRIGVQ